MRSPLTDRTVLVTGGAGFIGSHLVDALLEANEVRVLDDFSSGSRIHIPPGATVIQGNVRDEETLATAMGGVDVVFHHAAMVSVEESVHKPRACQSTNASATLSVLDQARLEDARVVFASSAAVYGHPDDVPIPESAPKRPQSPYGVTKLSGDLFVRRFDELYDLPTVALRYFNVYGPRHGGGEYSGVISVFMEQARNDGPVTIDGDGEQTRDFVHVSDVVQANLQAAVTENTGHAINVGSGSRVTIRELAETVCRVTDSTARIEHGQPRPGDVRHSCADVGKARRLLDFEPSVDLQSGLAALADDATVGR